MNIWRRDRKNAAFEEIAERRGTLDALVSKLSAERADRFVAIGLATFNPLR